MPLPEVFENRRRGLSYALVPGSEGAEGSRTRRLCKVVVTILAVLILTAGTVVFCRVYLGPVLKWLVELGGWQGPMLYGGMIIVSAIPPLSGYMILNVGAGYIYGVVRGTALTSVAALFGSLLAMVLCRYTLKSCTDKMLKSFSNLSQLARLMEGDQGLKIVMMTRLTPVPFGIQNALFSASAITFQRFGIATFVSLLPTQLLNSYLGTTLRSLDEVVKGNSNAGMMVAQVVLMIWVTWYVNRRMKREVALACERDDNARLIAAASINGSSSHDLLQALVQPDMRSSVGSVPHNDAGDLLESWIPFDLGIDDDKPFLPAPATIPRRQSDEKAHTTDVETSVGHRQKRPSSTLSRDKTVSERMPPSRIERDHHRSRSADLGGLRFSSTASPRVIDGSCSPRSPTGDGDIGFS